MKRLLPLPAHVLLLGLLSTEQAYSQTPIVRLNCGGGDVTAGDADFVADREYLPGVQGGYVGGTPGLAQSGAFGALIGGQDNPLREVHFSARQNWTAYRFEVPNGDYVVRLLLAENYNAGVGLRQFSVTLEGQPILSNVDLAAEIGVQYAGEFSSLVTVSDGVLDIEGTSSAGVDSALHESTILSGIEIFEAPAVFDGTEEPSGLVARPGYHRNMLTWDWRSDPRVRGYRVYRAAAAAGPFELVDELWSGPPRWFDDGAQPGQTYHYRVAGFDFAHVEGPPSNSVEALALDSAESGLRVYDITVSPENLEFISANLFTQPDTEVPAQFAYNGETWPDVEVRFRGNISKNYSKQSWKLKFTPGQRFEGRERLNLKASFLDESLLRERIAEALQRDAGVTGYESRYIHLRVNGEYLGTFVDVEQVDQRFLAARDRDTGASLYKCEGGMLVLPTVEAYESTYEKKTNESSGHSDLIDFIEFLDAAPGPDFQRELAQRFNLDHYLSYLAVLGWTGDWDTVLHNYYLCHDHSLERWEVFPWDADASLGLFPSLAYVTTLWGTSYAHSNPALIHGLRERVLTQDAFRWRYARKLIELDERYANAPTQLPRLQAFKNEIDTDMRADPYKNGWESPERFVEGSDYFTTYLPIRSAIVLAEAATLIPEAPPTEIWINEVVAADQDHFADDAGEFDDWLELYNASDVALDVSGMFLTDDFSDPTQFELPAGSVIPAAGHLVVICDKDPAITDIHANFKLSTKGEQVGLFDTDGTTLLDFIHWGPQLENVAFGRVADGAQFFELLPTPTPGTANTDLGNLPPRITWVENVPGLPTSSELVAITCKVVDGEGLSAVDLEWQVDGAGFSTTAMTPVGADRYEVLLPAQPDGSVVEFAIRAEDALGSEAWKPLGGPLETFTYVHTDPVQSLLRINEFMASNDTAVEDPDGAPGEFDDWIELYNGSEAAIDVGGMYLTDDLADPLQWQIPGSHSIPAGGHLLIWCDDEPEQGELHATFKLGAGGEEIGLFDRDSNGNALLDGLAYGPQVTDVAQGPLADGQQLNYLLLNPTPGSANRPALGEAVLFNTLNTSKNSTRLTPVGPPTPGTMMALQLDSGAANAFGLLYIGFETTVEDFGVLGDNLVQPWPDLWSFFVTDSNGEADLEVAITSNPAFVGISFMAQSLTTGASFSNAIHATIGP